tara:strand:- start:3129 stop:3347 length:219 start_codon:yes stop_codon:yes gene_type:complete
MDKKSDSWRFRKEIDISTLITIVIFALGLILWATKLESKVDQLDVLTENQLMTLEKRLDRIESKLDRVIANQ